MTKLAILSLLFLCSFSSNNLTDFLSDFVEDRDCKKIALSGNLLSFSNSDDVKSELDKFQLYIFDEDDQLSKNDVSKIKNEVAKDGFELLNMIKSDGTNVEIYVKESSSGNIIEDLFMMVKGDDSSILFYANGKLRYEDLKNLNLDFDGSDALKKL
jgi:hypothetical protein